MSKFLLKSFFAGIFIGLCSIAYMMNPGIIGAILFTIGLFGCINNKLLLFTGKIGYIKNIKIKNILSYAIMLLCNVLGIALFTGLIYYFTNNTMLLTAEKIVYSRLSTPYLGLLMGAIGCGMLMSHAVDRPTRSNSDFNNPLSYMPLLYCVPVFIMSCFPHCVADIGYYTVYVINYGFDIIMLKVWSICILGNIIGCLLMGNLMRKLFNS